MSKISPLFLCLLTAGLVLSCQPPDCDKQDCGSCGNACCGLEFIFTTSPSTVFSTFVSALKSGGADGKFKLVNTTDLRPQKLKSGAQYLVQTVHLTTSADNVQFNDTVNYVLSSNKSSDTVVRGFSVSGAFGSLCDEGQNYKNLVSFIKGLSQDYAMNSLFGCTNTLGNGTQFY